MQNPVTQFINEKQKELPKTITPKDVGRETNLVFTIEARTFLPQSNLPEKLLFIERLKKGKVNLSKIAYPSAWEENDYEYRFGYYIIGKIGKRKSKWTFGQFCPIISRGDLEKLILKAKKEKTII